MKSKPIKVAIGGRGSGKSIGIGDILTFKMATEGADIYCLREYQDSINDSVHRVFVGSIQERLKLDGWTVQENKVIAPNGALTTYRGAARNPDSIQSAQNYKYSWFEESHRASKASLDKLLPTILRNPGAECWFSANPQSSGDAFSERFINPYLGELEKNGYYEDDVHLIIVVNWRDNPWWNEEQERLRAWDYENRPRAEYDWIWEGKFNDSIENAIIKPEWFDSCIDAHLKLGITPKGQIKVTHDPSDLGDDDKALCLKHGSVILDVQTKDNGDVNDGCDWATSYAISKNADHFSWDGDGMGVGLRRQIDESLRGKNITFSMFRGSEGVANPDAIYSPSKSAETAKPKTNKETFKNKRAQHYWMLRDAMYNTYCAVEKGEYIDPEQLICLSSEIPHLQALRSEVCRIPLKPNGSGLIQIMTKEEMKRLGISSPNMADALMMAMEINGTINDKPKYMPAQRASWGRRK